MVAMNEWLLITDSLENRSKISRVNSVSEGNFVFPLWWLIGGRLNGARIVDSNYQMRQIAKWKVKGIASRSALGAPLLPYVLLMTFGLITLSTPVCVEFEVASRDTLTLIDLKTLLTDLMQKNASAYSKTPLDELLKRINRASSFEGLVRAFGSD